MPEFRKMHRLIEDAFSGTPATGSPEAKRARKSHLLQIAAIALITAAGLIIFGLVGEFAASLAIAGIFLLAGCIFIGVSLLQIMRHDLSGNQGASEASQEALTCALQENAIKNRLLATVSHDIRTPLSGISGMTHLLAQTQLTPEQANYLAGIRQSASALSHLVDDLLDFASIEAGRFQLRPQEDDLRQLIETIVEMMAHRAHEKGIEIASWVSADVPMLLSYDPARLRQVLYNIVGNAVKFTFTGGVLVKAGMERGALTISIRDTGSGMTKDEQARIFNEFEQAGSDRDKAAGTGLGLAISRRIISEAGGSIKLDSEPGVGSTFTIHLPVVQSGDFGARQARRSTLCASKVLLAAPAGVTSEALAETVKTLGGECVIAHDADSAESLLRTSKAENSDLTDMIVDDRLAQEMTEKLESQPDLCPHSMRKIFLLSPEARMGTDFRKGFDSWLIRPLRERSLVGVLQGRMKGIELRDPLADSKQAINSRWTQAGSQSLNVLLAEDDPINRLLMRTVLQKAGHHVREVEDFKSLLKAATQPHERPDIIVSDLSMPGGDGFETLSSIRDFERGGRLATLPVIVVTASTGADIREKALQAGAQEVLSKPAEPKELTSLIASYALKKSA